VISVRAGDPSHGGRFRIRLITLLIAGTGVVLVLSVGLLRSTRGGAAVRADDDDPGHRNEAIGHPRTDYPSGWPSLAQPVESAPIDPTGESVGTAPPTDDPEPAAPVATPPKRADVTPAALAVERTRIALAALGPREEALRRSGDGAAGPTPAWHASADGFRGELARSLIAIPGIRVTGLTCCQAGCSFTVDAADDGANVQSSARLRMLLRGEMPNPFSGESFVSGLVTRPDGALRTTVILYAPSSTDEAAAK
jgi:hypothetical protein